MSFAEIAQPFAELGIKVFPLQPGRKEPPTGLTFLTEATTSLEKIQQWNREDATYTSSLEVLGACTCLAACLASRRLTILLTASASNGSYSASSPSASCNGTFATACS